jgi:hypothetical protein
MAGETIKMTNREVGYGLRKVWLHLRTNKRAPTISWNRWAARLRTHIVGSDNVTSSRSARHLSRVMSHPVLITWSQATFSANLSYRVVAEISFIVSCSKYGVSKTLFIIYLQDHLVSKKLSFIAFPQPDGRFLLDNTQILGFIQSYLHIPLTAHWQIYIWTSNPL